MLAGACFLQASIDPDYSIPSTKEETDAFIFAFKELKDGRKLKPVRGKSERRGLGKLPLGREELDVNSAEADVTPIYQKVERIQTVLQSGLHLMNAIALYRYRYDDSGYEHVLSRLPRALFALAAYAFHHSA